MIDIQMQVNVMVIQYDNDAVYFMDMKVCLVTCLNMCDCANSHHTAGIHMPHTLLWILLI